ncbi:MAG TPA: CheW domain-containing protein [Longimicrobiales bacterium]|nr:CheW domain-containing protein [Longimicrobiales bacterium]
MLLSGVADPARLNVATPRWVVAQSGDLLVGLSARQAREILEAPALTRLPGGRAAVGVMSLRGRILPVFALDRLLGIGARDETGRPVVLVEVDGRTAGFVVDRVVGVEAASVKPAASSADLPPGAAGTCSYEGGTFIGLDAAALLQDAFRTRQAETESDREWHARF